MREAALTATRIKVVALHDNPGTPGERQAAAEAIKRIDALLARLTVSRSARLWAYSPWKWASGCVTCGAAHTGWFGDGSPRYPSTCNHPPVYVDNES